MCSAYPVVSSVFDPYASAFKDGPPLCSFQFPSSNFYRVHSGTFFGILLIHVGTMHYKRLNSQGSMGSHVHVPINISLSSPTSHLKQHHESLRRLYQRGQTRRDSGSGEYQKDKVLLFLCDVFGPQLPNAQLLVDGFAKNGFKTVAPDLFEKDGLPFDVFDSEAFDLPAWFGRHGPHVARPLLHKVITALKEQDVTTFASTGYCYGGRLVFDLAFENITSASIANHPSLLKSPDDLEKYFSSSRAPLLLNTCTTDEQFPIPAQSQADVIFGDGKFAPGYKREYFDGCTHGFAVRGDLSIPQVKAGKEGAFKAAVEWLYKYGFGPEGKTSNTYDPNPGRQWTMLSKI
ncbi:dienelactone hydrolase family-domain-containing protein [Lentinula lateritia]|uniref:Dienelactone hydrolase family-domain-containing protein n=1 Tax=Lentinula lateritia TaxID=40482 RepID=A0ABQ8V3E7_9AGAR|nr:dienelactone hydrolase family-domain-containing protein [Lentinula lateritia]